MKIKDPKAYIALSLFWLAFNLFFIWTAIGEIEELGIVAGVWILILSCMAILNFYIILCSIKELKKT